MAPALAVLLAACGATPPAAERPPPPPLPPVVLSPPGVATCPPRQARVRLSVVDREPMLSTGAGVREMHAETRLPQRDTAHHLALTTSRIDWLSEVDIRYARAPRGAPAGPETYCAVPGAVTLTLMQAEHLMRLAREIPEGSCLFTEVEAHERRHVAVNRAALERAARRIRTAAEAWARTAEGRGATLEEAKAALGQGLRRAVEPALSAMRREQERGHRSIDTQAEYRRLATVCPEDQAVLRERLRGG